MKKNQIFIFLFISLFIFTGCTDNKLKTLCESIGENMDKYEAGEIDDVQAVENIKKEAEKVCISGNEYKVCTSIKLLRPIEYGELEDCSKALSVSLCESSNKLTKEMNEKAPQAFHASLTSTNMVCQLDLEGK
jgi:hypothetical protein